MPKKYYKLRGQLINQWPEVLKDVCVSSMPLAYLNAIKLEFSDGRLWEIEIQSRDIEDREIELNEKVSNILDEYDEEIVKVDFDVDVKKLKSDIKQTTKKLF